MIMVDLVEELAFRDFLQDLRMAARVLTKLIVVLSVLEVSTDADGYRASVAQFRVILPEAT